MSYQSFESSPGSRVALRAIPLGLALSMLGLLALLLGAAPAAAEGGSAGGTGGGVCKRTSYVLMQSCTRESAEDFFEAKAICLNLTDAEERHECRKEAREELWETKQECHAVHDARNEVCHQLGNGAYDPDFDPELFATSFDSPNLNPFQPLEVGHHWEYSGDGETIVIDVLDETKAIEGVTCVTVRDEAFEDGILIESTDDWVAQHEDGDTWYCGEISQNFEVFEGDDPDFPELVDIDGSWKAGRDGAKAGILVPADAPPGFTYRQEYAIGDAEDVATVVSRTYGYGNDPELDYLVPEELAELLCDDDCMVTRDYTPFDPEEFELKYYAPGIGLFLETKPEEDEFVQISACNMDPRCDDLPDVD